MDRCVGCGACIIACQEEWSLPPGVARNWVRPLWPQGEQPVFTHCVGLCNHCQDAPCIGACPTGATYRDHNNRVVVDANACIGCGYCAHACPWGARTVRQDTGVVDKCDFCAPLVDAGYPPACVATCPAEARLFGDLDEREGALSRAFRERPVRQLQTAQVSTDPQVFYTGKKALLDRIAAEHPPDPQGLEPPLAGRVLRDGLRPGFFGLLAVALFGDTLAFARQLAGPAEEAEHDAAPMLRRHDTAIILLHWFNAAVWLFQLVTGAGLLGSRDYRVVPGFVNQALLAIFGSPAVMLKFHIAVAALWMAVLLVYGVLGFKRYLVPFVSHLRLRRDDLRWLRVTAGHILRRSREPLPPQDKYNAGQKLFGLAVAAGTLLVIASGMAMALLPGGGEVIQWAIPVHFAGTGAVVAGTAVHIYMAAVLPSERPVFFSMLHGRIPESFARERYARWWERMTRGERTSR
ncbi:MAG: cytochrome b/b6 domain-containing protein [Deltaproteobacteria bacterium]|nr:cytochrome b/b6 domain-containing protein [Deltaproteobacteria bacterium]